MLNTRQANLSYHLKKKRHVLQIHLLIFLDYKDLAKLYLISKDAARLVDPNKFETVKNEKESKKNRQIKKNSKK